VLLTAVITAGLALVYGSFAVAMYCYQRQLIYRIDRRRVAPASLGLAQIEEVKIVADDGTRLIAWYGAPEAGRPTLLYCHGQSGNLAVRTERIRLYRAAGLGLLMLAYRGYSGSEGEPSETANVADAMAAHAWLKEHGTPPSSIVGYGESLGTGVATQLAARTELGALVLDAPFTSLVELAAQRHPWLPVRSFVLDRYDSLAAIGVVRAPLLVLQCERDPIVPASMGKALYAAANEPKRLATFTEGRHLNHTKYGSMDVLREFLAEHVKSGPGTIARA
jgi:uncharacterized protein